MSAFHSLQTVEGRAKLAAMLVKLECPFCHKEVKPEAEDFRWVTIVTPEGWRGEADAPQQDFGCHFECLERRLGGDLPLL